MSEVIKLKNKFIAALKRAGWTAAEVALAMIPVGVGIEGVEWQHVLSVVAVAALISILKSVVAGMPEVKLEQQITYLDDELIQSDRDKNN